MSVAFDHFLFSLSSKIWASTNGEFLLETSNLLMNYKASHLISNFSHHIAFICYMPTGLYLGKPVHNKFCVSILIDRTRGPQTCLRFLNNPKDVSITLPQKTLEFRKQPILVCTSVFINSWSLFFFIICKQASSSAQSNSHPNMRYRDLVNICKWLQIFDMF